MGPCASKSSSQAVSANPTVTKRTVKHSKPAAAKAKAKTEKPIKREPPHISKSSKGDKIVTNGDDTNREKLSASEAAKLAAEKRLKESNDKSTKGELGKKLAEERSKSYKTQMMEQIEKQNLQKANEQMVYD